MLRQVTSIAEKLDLTVKPEGFKWDDETQDFHSMEEFDNYLNSIGATKAHFNYNNTGKIFQGPLFIGRYEYDGISKKLVVVQWNSNKQTKNNMLENIKAIDEELNNPLMPGGLGNEGSKYTVFVTTSSNNRMIWLSKENGSNKQGSMTFNEDEAAKFNSQGEAENVAKEMSDVHGTQFIVGTASI